MPLFGMRKREQQKPISDYDVLRIMELIDATWVNIAAAAWQGFDGYGRGFLFMDFEEDTTKYVPASNPHFAAARDPQWRDIQRKVRSYNPESEVVLVLNHFAADSMTTLQQFTPEGMPTPPVAYRQIFGGS